MSLTIIQRRRAGDTATLGQVWRGDGLRASQIGDGARQFEDAVEGARRELQPLHRRARSGCAAGSTSQNSRTSAAPSSVAGHPWRAGEASRLDRPHRPHAFAHRHRALGLREGVLQPCLDALRAIWRDAQALRDLIRRLEPDAPHVAGEAIGFMLDDADGRVR